MTTDYFAAIDPIRFEGPESVDPLAYRYYDRDRVVLGKRMEDHLRMAVCFWHTFCWPGSDVFGEGTLTRPWSSKEFVTPELANLKLENAFSFFARLGLPFYSFHDADVMPTARTIREHVDLFTRTVDAMERKQIQTGIRLLWGTANLFSHPRYAAGAATNPDPEVFAWAATQVRHALDATHRLGGANYVLWGGREGYDTLLNTDLERELSQLGRFMSLVVEHKHKIGFKGAILIEPKPFEPTKHQYDRDVAAVLGFLHRNGLEKEIKLNIEANHATLAGLSFEHEIAMAIAHDSFGSIDMNRGDPQNGWDTDQFPNNVAEMTLALYHILQGGGFTTGGINFDAKIHRQSLDAEDLFHAHIGGVDVVARGLLNAAALIEDGQLSGCVEKRYLQWNGDLGRRLMQKNQSLASIADAAVAAGLNPQPNSGRQEYLENLVNRFV